MPLMNSQRFDKNFLTFGLFVSLSWHLFWIFVVVPVANFPAQMSLKSHSVFLGTILKSVDFSLDSSIHRRDKYQKNGPQKDFSREKYFSKNAEAFYKPNVGFFQKEPLLPVGSVEAGASATASRPSESISFGFSDFTNYLSGTDFSDLMKIASRSDEDLAGFVEFKVWLTPQGEVRSIKKTTSSGDPSLDFSVMLRLKKAVFRPSFIPVGRLLNVRFWIKK